MQFTIFTANCTGKRQNCSYPKRVSVTDEASLKAAVAYDHTKLSPNNSCLLIANKNCVEP